MTRLFHHLTFKKYSLIKLVRSAEMLQINWNFCSGEQRFANLQLRQSWIV